MIPGQPGRDAARIAVITPSHNDGHYLRAAIDSIDEREPVEVVVVDDASVDELTLRVLEDLESERIRVLRNEANRGLGWSRNRGLAATSAPYVFPLDADDLLLAGALGRMADLLDANPGAAFCVGDYEEFGARNARIRVARRLDPFRIAYRNPFGAPLLRRDALEAIGGWLPEGIDGRTIHGYEDWHVWMALAERGADGVHAGDGVVYRRRIESGRLLAEARRTHRELYRNLKALHPRLFSQLRIHRHRSDLGPVGRYLYPVLYGARPRLGIEATLLSWLSRARIPTPGRRAPAERPNETPPGSSL